MLKKIFALALLISFSVIFQVNFYYTEELYNEDFYLNTDTPKISGSKDNKTESLIIEGKTNLPDDSILNVTLHYLPSCIDQEYKKEDILIELRKCKVLSQTYQTSFGPFEGKLPSGTYIVFINFNPAKQYKHVKTKLKNTKDKLTQRTKLCHGTDQQRMAERDRKMEIIKKQIAVLKEVFDDLENSFRIYAKVMDEKSWQEKLKQYKNNIKQSVSKCQPLDPLKVFKKVSESKLLTESFAYKLTMIIDFCDQALSSTETISSEKYEAVVKAMDYFRQYMNENLDKLRITKSIDSNKLIKQISRIKAHLKDIEKKIISSDFKQWIKKEKQYVSNALLQLSVILNNSDYRKISTISNDLLALWGMTEKDDLAETAKSINKILDNIKSTYIKE